MSQFMLAVSGLKLLRAELTRAERELNRKMERDLATAAKWIRDDAKKNISGTRDANPAARLGVDSGDLRNAITYDVKATRSRFGRQGRARAEIGPEGWPLGIYARVHELGLRRWAARPYLSPALDRNKARIFRLFGKFVGLLK
jgi:HK97 gp10 family phage protein